MCTARMASCRNTCTSYSSLQQLTGPVFLPFLRRKAAVFELQACLREDEADEFRPAAVVEVGQLVARHGAPASTCSVAAAQCVTPTQLMTPVPIQHCRMGTGRIAWCAQIGRKPLRCSSGALRPGRMPEVPRKDPWARLTSKLGSTLADGPRKFVLARELG